MTEGAPTQTAQSPSLRRHAPGFTLVEVVLAIGIFLVTVLALVGLLGPTLQSVDEVEETDEVVSVVQTVNSFLQDSPDIAPNGSKFNAIYEAVASGDSATLFVFRRFQSDSSTDIELAVGFDNSEESIDSRARITDFDNGAGTIYRVVLSASSVTPDSSLADSERNASTGVYSLAENDPLDYPEGYLAMEVRIFAEDWNPNFNPAKLPSYGPDAPEANLSTLSELEPIFTYNTAIVR